MSDLVRCFEQMIAPDWLLEREKGEWLLSESQAVENQHGLLRIHGGPSLAFSLDRPRFDPWPFLKAANHPGIRGMCDALVLVQKDNCTYAVAVEMKSKDEGGAVRQIENARLLMNWLFGLLELHGHWRGECQFCGVISFTPRRQERKGTTARTPLPEPHRSHWGYPVFRLRNHPRLNLMELLDAVRKLA